MKIKRILLFCILTLLMFISNVNIYAQCAMCRTSVESDLNNGGSIGKELNTGILYLMAIPYILLLSGAYVFFKKPIDAKVKAWKEKHFPTKQSS
ncbi:MAG: hypothetical protein NTX97_13030 [Bacteroidetes bacterium]|nr:hypothetical protein [Bacteroidota bacterium]